MSSVLVWILYDIVEDKPRNEVAKECKKYGLVQVQKIVFRRVKVLGQRFDRKLVNDEILAKLFKRPGCISIPA